MNNICDSHGAAHDQRLNCYESTGEECIVGTEATNKISPSKLENMVVFQVPPDTFTNETQQLSNDGLRIPRPLILLTKIKKKAAGTSPFRKSYQAFLLSREMLVKGCIKLAGVISRTAVVCFAPSNGADEDDLPYSQLDKVTHTLRKEAFGPLYLVT